MSTEAGRAGHPSVASGGSSAYLGSRFG